jgi:hypothetical protein
MLTMKQARREFAGREMVSPAEFEQGKKTRARVNRREVRTQSFRAWVRATYRSYAHVSPKLARVLRSEPAAAAA